MTSHTAVVSTVEEIDAEVRWREWQARGASSDRRTAARMRKVVLAVVVAWIAWAVAQLA